jgi:uncharacterized protein YjbI with pentapeptide repeats
MGSRFGACVVSAAVAAALTAGMVSFAPAATAASSCPTVDQQTGAVAPPPAPGADWSNCNLDHADLAGADLANASLDSANLHYANVSGANLTGANLTGANLGYANLSGATLSGAEMYFAMTGFTDLSSADLTNADLSSAWILDDTSLDQADLTGAKLNSIHSRNITGTPTAIPPSWRLIDGYLVGPTSDLFNAHLPGADLSGMNLARATLAGGDFSDTDLAGADLKGADLSGTRLPGANLSGTNLTGANLYGIESGEVRGIPTGIPAPWVLKEGYFFGPHANLMNARLSGLDLRAMHLAGADFFDARLAGTNLAHLDLKGAFMVQADLVGADLFGANVRGVQWHGARCPGGIAATSCTRAFGFAGFASPKPGAVVRRSARSLTAVFKLYASRQEAPLTNAIARAIASAHQVRVTLTGKGIKPVAGLCSWDTAHAMFRCRFAIPRHLRTGRSHPYHLTAQEKPGGGFIAAPKATIHVANPATIYFR